MDAHIIAIGTELIEGDTPETNSNWLEKELINFGVKVRSVLVISDDIDTIAKSIEKHIGTDSILIITGGLGPTADDLTREGIAKAFNIPLIPSEETKIALVKALNKAGFPNVNIPEKIFQAPSGAEILFNPAGVAPGLVLKIGRLRVYVFPGVPRELKAIFNTHIKQRLPKQSATGAIPRYYLIFGIGESVSEKMLKSIKDNSIPENYVITASVFGIRIKFWLPDDNTVIKSVDNLMKQTFTDHLVDYGSSVSLINKISELLKKENERSNITVGCAESCTGGLFGKLLTDIPGSSLYFTGGIISYSNDAKQKLLGVSPDTLEKHGAVSEQVAMEMAAGAQKALSCNLAIAFTGIAGPDGGTKDKPVGTVWIGWKLNDKKPLAKSFRFFGNRDEVRMLTAHAGLDIIRRELMKNEPDV